VPAPSSVAGPARLAEGALRVGLIGPGSFASRVLVPAFIAAGARLEIVGGGSGQSAEAASRGLGFARIAADEDDVINDPAVDAVVIATRHGTHAYLAKRALDAGKHVFCEKPLALSEAELEAVLAAAGSAHGQLLVGFNRRYSPLITQLRDFLAEQDVPLTAAYRVSAGQIEQGSWVHDLDQGGGRAIGEACHFVDTLRFLVGKPVTAIHAIGYGQPGAPVQARDNLVISLSFADGSAGTIIYSAAGSAHLPKERLEVFRGARTAVLDDYRALELYGPLGRRTVKTRSQEKGHREEAASFIAGIRGGTVSMSLDEIANVSRASIAIAESVATGRPVAL
jgi:predicted dehydrogenase